MTLPRRILMVLATAAILAFFSEFFFVNEGPAGDLTALLAAGGPALLWWPLELILWYGFPAYLFLAAIGRFQVRSLAALFLAGALYGFAVEGIVIWQMYEALPYTISWTPLGWHVLVDVLLGWLLVRRVLQRDQMLTTAGLAVGLGLFWGIWATWNAAQLPLSPPAEFGALALFSGTIWIAGTFILDRWGGAAFQPSRVELGLLALVGAGLFAVQILPVFPLALLFLPPLLLLTGWLLWRNQAQETRPSILASFPKRPRPRNYALLFLTPLTAAAAYMLVYEAAPLPLLDLVPPLLMAAGFLGYGLSALRILRPQVAEAATSDAPA